MNWPDPCTCTPGEEATGWHEVRSPECVAHEHEIWRLLVQRINSGRRLTEDEFWRRLG